MNDKPVIDDKIKENWQEVIDLMAEILDVPAGLIMKVHSETIEVFLSSHTKDNPYISGEVANLKSGLYCEMVMATRNPLLVSNAFEDSKWNKNPDLKLNMSYYLGYPLMWPDGHVFGTICVLDCKNNNRATEYVHLLEKFKVIVESDMEILFKDNKLRDTKRKLLELQDKYNELKRTIRYNNI